MRILGQFFGNSAPSRADRAFGAAMQISDDLISTMRETSKSKDVFRAIMADIWAQHHNIPFMATVYEAVREMKSATTDQENEQHPQGT